MINNRTKRVFLLCCFLWPTAELFAPPMCRRCEHLRHGAAARDGAHHPRRSRDRFLRSSEPPSCSRPRLGENPQPSDENRHLSGFFALVAVVHMVSAALEGHRLFGSMNISRLFRPSTASIAP